MNNGMNPILQVVQMVRGSRDPMQMLMQMSQQNPGVNQAMQMLNGKTPDQMREMVMAQARSRGVDLNQVAQMMGLQVPK